MPRFDGAGPMDTGPMTGRGLGPCGGGSRGLGRGRGWGLFMGTCPWYGRGPVEKISPDQEKEMLKEQIEVLKENLDATQKRFNDLQK